MDKKVQLIRDNAEKYEINHPNHSNQLFIDCYIANLTNQFSDDTDVFDAPEIQAVCGAMLDLFKSRNLDTKSNQIIDDLINHKLSLKEAQQKLSDLIKGRRIRYIPFGSKLYKDLHKIKRHQGHLTPLLGKYSDSFFGMFYFEKLDQNKVKNIIEKYLK